MDEFQVFLDIIDQLDHRERMQELFNHITDKFPQLKKEIKWKQPMFSDHGTFIIGFSVAKQHMSIAPEAVVLDRFDSEIKKAGYKRTKEIFKIKWTDDIDFDLIDEMIAFNIEDKKDMTNFWR